MKTRLMTNKQSDSFRLDIITKDNEIESHYFKTEKEAKDFLTKKDCIEFLQNK